MTGACGGGGGAGDARVSPNARRLADVVIQLLIAPRAVDNIRSTDVFCCDRDSGASICLTYNQP
jgi:hypothetical protein